MADEELVLSSLADGVLTVTLNRPDRLNAWTRRLERQYFTVLDEADDDPAVRAIVVTGAGRGFCPGMDTQSLAKAAAAEPSAPDPRPMTHGLSVRKPMVAAINGACAGIGLVQALVCDVRFAAAGAKLATAFSRRGLPAEFSASWLLERLVGYGHALDLLLSGRPVTAEEALTMGLVNWVVAPDELLSRAQGYAADLVANCSPVAMAAIKAQVAADWNRSEPDAFADASARAGDAYGHPDFAEGVTSYIERRPPRFEPLPPKRSR
ncbi:MAG TPA: enoyl-CoA hydratase-related protein [Acidimicrobiales bacterium]|nr:enoyl-CoA hydratase-related protein [Acidimicrobiales bacterium]